MRTTSHVRLPVQNGAASTSFRDIAAPLFRRRRTILTCFASTFVLIMLLAAFRGLSYTSRMAVLVNRERLDPLVSTEATTHLITNDNSVTQEEINSEVELLRSHDILEQVVVANGLEKNRHPAVSFALGGENAEPDRVARAVTKLARDLKIAPVADSNLIGITYSSSDPQRSFRVLNSLVTAYLAKHVAVHRPAGSYEFFAKETEKYRSELNQAEDSVKRFSQAHAIAAPNEQKTQLAEQAAAAVGVLHQAEEAIRADEARIRADQRQVNITPRRSLTQQESSTNDKLIDDLNAALLAAVTRRTQLALKYDPSYPLVKEAEQEVAQDRAAIAEAEEKKYVTETTDRDPTYELLREDIAKTESDLAAQRGAHAATQQSIQKIQAQMVSLDQLALSLQDLQREAKAAEDNYLLYLGKREQERASNALDVTRIANVAVAVPPAIPVLPVLGWPLIVLISVAASSVISIGVGYAVEYLDSSFHTPSDVTKTLGIPVVVAMPKRTA